MKSQCTHSDTGLCESCFKYELEISALEAKLQKMEEALRNMTAKNEANLNDGGTCKYCGFHIKKEHRKDCKWVKAVNLLTPPSQDCPDCEGKKKYQWFGCGSTVEWRDCETCKGTGKI